MRNTRSLTRCSSIAWRTTIVGASLSYKNTVGNKGSSMKRCPDSGSEFRETLDGEIREPREGRLQGKALRYSSVHAYVVVPFVESSLIEA